MHCVMLSKRLIQFIHTYFFLSKKSELYSIDLRCGYFFGVQRIRESHVWLSTLSGTPCDQTLSYF